MKRLYYIMVILVGGLLISSSVFSQEVKLTREEKKALRKAEAEYNYRILDSLLTSKRFVLVADFLQSKTGERVPVNQTINFIKVNVENGVLQTGSNSGLGSNSVGGVTAEGSIGAYEISKDRKNLTYSVRFGINTQIGHYDVLLNVSAGNLATATITGLSYGSLTWHGHLETIERSRVFKGQNSI